MRSGTPLKVKKGENGAHKLVCNQRKDEYKHNNQPRKERREEQRLSYCFKPLTGGRWTGDQNVQKVIKMMLANLTINQTERNSRKTLQKCCSWIHNEAPLDCTWRSLLPTVITENLSAACCNLANYFPKHSGEAQEVRNLIYPISIPSISIVSTFLVHFVHVSTWKWIWRFVLGSHSPTWELENVDSIQD